MIANDSDDFSVKLTLNAESFDLNLLPTIQLQFSCFADPFSLPQSRIFHNSIFTLNFHDKVHKIRNNEISPSRVKIKPNALGFTFTEFIIKSHSH